MTICIAAMADDRSVVVVASDRMLSAHFLSLEFDHPDSKIESLGRACVGLSAGDALPTGELFLSAQMVSAQLQNPQIGHIADSIKKTYIELRSQRIEEQFFKPRGITIADFYQGGLIRQFPQEIAMFLDDSVQRGEFGVELIIAGVDGSGAHIVGITDPGRTSQYDRIGYHAIGSGMSHAILNLVGSGQNWSKSINETVFNVFCSKRQAEAAPGVGRAIEMRIVTDQVIISLTEDDLNQLDKVYEELTKSRNKTITGKIQGLPFNEFSKKE